MLSGVVAAGWFAPGHMRAQAADGKAIAKVERDAVQLTVYTDDFGMVQENRPARLTQGDNSLQIPEVSKQMDPQSVLLNWQNAGANQPVLVSHAYDLGISSGQALLQRYLGKEVQVVRYGQDGREAERQTGELAMSSNGETVLREGGDYYIEPTGVVAAPVQP
ncbi:MAG TPA: hypothetical protein VGS41_16515, partial [Chthonomonadales bacterium]|nr:hypothetical protein [Chthonomonadales bacterium]